MTPDKLHQHLIVRAEVNQPPGVDDCARVEAWMSKLIKDIGMKELMAPRAVYCPVIGNRGMTAVAIIETSHVVIHTWDEENPVVQFDCYTCSDLDVGLVVESLSIFAPTKVEWKFLDRAENLTLVAESGK